jgi:exonuclease III
MIHPIGYATGLIEHTSAASKQDIHAKNRLRQPQRHPFSRQEGLLRVAAKGSADFVCVQELKAQAADMTEDFRPRPATTAISTMPRRRATRAWASTAAASRIGAHRLRQYRIR